MTFPKLDCTEIALLQQLNRKTLERLPQSFVDSGLAKEVSKGYKITKYGKAVLKDSLPYAPSRTIMTVPYPIARELEMEYKNRK